MENSHLAEATLYLVQGLVYLFLGILFPQAGIDKVIDRQGNLEWLRSHLAKSPLAGMVPLLFGVLTIVEVSAGGLSGIGFLALIFSHNSTIAFYGAILSATTVIALFFGQRIAKEYAGPAILVPYFLVTLFPIYLLAN